MAELDVTIVIPPTGNTIVIDPNGAASAAASANSAASSAAAASEDATEAAASAAAALASQNAAAASAASVNPGAPNGTATLDSGGHIPTSQLPSAVLGAMSYQGTWNAATNTPTLTSGTGTKGWFYKVSVAGSTTLDGISQWNVGDEIAFDGTTWDKFAGIASEVVSVAGRTGAVNLAVADVSGAAPLAAPAFTGDVTINAVGGSTSTLTINASSDANGANIFLEGNGATTPNKSIRANSGVFQILNSGYTAAILALDDSGNLSVPGSFSAASLSNGLYQQGFQTYKGFTQTGAGMVARTAQDKMSDTINVRDAGAKVDALQLNDGAITSGTAAFTSASAVFTSADVGKTVIVDGAGASGAPLITTISAFTSATAVTLAASAGATVSGAITIYGTDDTTAINVVLSALKVRGGGRAEIDGASIISSQLRISSNQIFLVGRGGAVDGNVTYVGGMAKALASLRSKLIWAGPAGQNPVLFTPYPDDGTQAALVGGGLLDVAIDGANQAGIGLDLKTLRYARFENVSVLRCTQINWKIGTTVNNVLGGNKSLAFCGFRNITGSNSTITGNTAKTMVLYGHVTDGNVALNKWDNVGLYSASGVGSHIEIENCDSNTLMHMHWNGDLTLHATDTGTYSTGSAVARHNVFFNPQGHIIAKAKIATPHIQGTNGYDSYGNMAFGYSRENSIAYPTIEAYADFQFHETGLGLTNSQGGISFGKAPAICLMAKTTNQSVASGSTVTVAWDAVSYDWLGSGSAGTGKITAPNGAKWVRFSYGAEWDVNSAAGRFVGIRLNGSTYLSKVQGVGYISSESVATTQWFAITPGDYYEMLINQNTGSALNLLGTPSTYMQAEWC